LHKIAPEKYPSTTLRVKNSSCLHRTPHGGAETRHSNFILGNRIQKYPIIYFTKKVESVKCGLDTDF
jgi:hypothetical protein